MGIIESEKPETQLLPPTAALLPLLWEPGVTDNSRHFPGCYGQQRAWRRHAVGAYAGRARATAAPATSIGVGTVADMHQQQYASVSGRGDNITFCYERRR